MTPGNRDRLYQLLPALYRASDERQGQSLRALLAVLESEFDRLEQDLAAAYDDWFITTCDDWVVPYIADLLGIGDLQDVHRIPSQRRLVANTIAYRRRKGTLAALEHAVRDATGWYARAVELAQLVASTQHIARTWPDSGRTVNVRRLRSAAEANGPLDTLAHTVDVDNGDQGKFSLDRIGLYIWRLRSYPIRRSLACPIENTPGCFTFDPLGRDIPLFHQPQPVTRITHSAQPCNLPLRLSREDLAADLQAFRARYGAIEANWRPANSRLYGPDCGLSVEREGRRIPPSDVASADLSEWPDLAHLPDGAVVAIDVELGRLAFGDKRSPSDVRVNYNYGSNSDIGGGPYGRQFWLDEPAPETHHIYVAKGSQVDTLQAAVRLWDEHCKASASAKQKPIARITILDNGLYKDEDVVIHLPRGAQLTIAAGDGVRPIMRPTNRFVVTTERHPRGLGPLRKEEAVEPIIDRLLQLNGLVIYGGMQLGTPHETFQGKLDVKLQHCTLMPDGLRVQFKEEEDAAKLRVAIQHSIVGPLRLPAKVAGFSVQDSIIDHAGGYAIAAFAAEDHSDLPPEQVPGPPVTLERTTVFGKVSLHELPSASEVIFTETVFVGKRDHGGVSFSYVPADSQTPSREFCQPAEDVSASAVRPKFTSVRFGDPAYAQLRLDCPPEIRRGGKNGTEMGVFGHLHHPQREISLEHILEDYIPCGMNAAISYVT